MIPNLGLLTIYGAKNIKTWNIDTNLAGLYELKPLGVELRNPFGVDAFNMLRCTDGESDNPSNQKKYIILTSEDRDFDNKAI